jgi:alkanesulfonate monooxygenase SsuD/methylene tetrahydromethanopterin reductase-like flavin-dependent oxidoreductase (luciferase family)
MKFTWFNLMPWPYLPDDFREKNRSVWVDIDQSLFDPAKCHEVYNDYLDLLEYADQLGYDGVGINEHHQNGAPATPPSSCSATPSHSTTRRSGWPRNSRCSTS